MKILVFGSLNIDRRYIVDHFVQPGETLSSLDVGTFSTRDAFIALIGKSYL